MQPKLVEFQLHVLDVFISVLLICTFPALLHEKEST